MRNDDGKPSRAFDLLFGLTLLAPTLLVSCANPKTAAVPTDAGGEGLVLAVVGGTTITAAELRTRILDRYYGNRALIGMVREQLFRQQARALKVEVDPVEIERRVDDELERLLEELGSSRDALERDLEAMNLDVESFRPELRAEIATQLLIQRVVAAHRVISEADIRAAFDRTYRKTRVRARHIAVPFEVSGQPSVEVIEATRLRAERVRKRILAGEEFAHVARKISANPTTAGRGGEIGWVDEDSLDPAVTQALFRLAPGEVSDPVRERDYGFHLLLVEERREAQPLAAVRDEIRETLLAAPPSADEVRGVEARIRERVPVILFPDALKD